MDPSHSRSARGAESSHSRSAHGAEGSDPLELRGIAAPPTTNGELVFDAPWQGRVFGMARALAEQGLYSWDDFRSALIAAIERDARAASSTSTAFAYYDRFFEAFVALLESRGLIAGRELEARFETLASRPHGHDHVHRHDHDDHDDADHDHHTQAAC